MVNYWVIASGGTSRNLQELFFKYGAAFLGSSGLENYYENIAEFHKRKPRVVAFFEEMQEGDVLLLKNGLKEILAAGIVKHTNIEDTFCQAFTDVYDFNLSNVRFVDWYVHPLKPVYNLRNTQFPGGKFYEVHKEEPKEIADKIISENHLANSKPSPLPKEGQDFNKIGDEKLIKELIKRGLSSSDVEKLVFEIGRIKNLAEWYAEEGEDISENETVSFLILPSLHILGWSERQLKLELNHVDIVAYDKPYTKHISDDDCKFLLEAKEPEKGLAKALEQVIEYAQNNKRFAECETLVASNGYVYEIMKKKNDRWETYAYMNVFQLYDRCPFNPYVNGALQVFEELMAK